MESHENVQIMYASYANIDVSNWDVSNVRNMDRVFDQAYSFNKDISSWDVSSVTSMNYMFKSKIVQSRFGCMGYVSVTDMQYMFNGAIRFNQPLRSWITSSVTDKLHVL